MPITFQNGMGLRLDSDDSSVDLGQRLGYSCAQTPCPEFTFSYYFQPLRYDPEHAGLVLGSVETETLSMFAIFSNSVTITFPDREVVTFHDEAYDQIWPNNVFTRITYIVHSNETISVYVNKNQASAVSREIDMINPDDIPTNTYLGKPPTSPFNVSLFVIDDLQVWHRALTEAEISALVDLDNSGE